MPEIIIVDASVLIALEKIDLLPILCEIYEAVICPDGVVREFGNINIPCQSTQKVESKLVNLLMHGLNLGKGEAEVIALAYETGQKALIDDLKARKVAIDLGLTISGTIGILLNAEKAGLVESAHKKIMELKGKGFHVAEELLDEISKRPL